MWTGFSWRKQEGNKLRFVQEPYSYQLVSYSLCQKTYRNFSDSSKIIYLSKCIRYRYLLYKLNWQYLIRKTVSVCMFKFAWNSGVITAWSEPNFHSLGTSRSSSVDELRGNPAVVARIEIWLAQQYHGSLDRTHSFLWIEAFFYDLRKT